MQLEEVMKHYVERKKDPTIANGLLDFIQQLYINEKIPFQDYRVLCKQVHELGATKPDYYYFNEQTSKMNISSR